jgi:hypothetical protein
LAVVGRSHPQERLLTQTLKKWWNYESGDVDDDDSKPRPVDFELQGLPYNRDPLPSELLNHSYFWLSDHSR